MAAAEQQLLASKRVGHAAGRRVVQTSSKLLQTRVGAHSRSAQAAGASSRCRAGRVVWRRMM
jgi:hypothetical protein